jgi:hypothetical protein
MMMTFESCIVVAALGELGHGEVGGNNDGPHVWKYREWIDDRAPWCAAFSYWLLVTAASMSRRPLPKPLWRTHSALRLGELIGRAGQVLTVPEPGSFLVWYRGAHRAMGQGHIGPVEEYDADTDTAHTIEGNKGPSPSPVAKYSYRKGLWRKDLAMIVTTRRG